MERYKVLDETGKVKAWLDAGRGVTVWVNQEIGRDRPDKLTPGDVTEAPHWAYQKQATYMDAADLLFYQPVYVRSHNTWSDTPAGWEAAQRALDKLPDHDGPGPIGHIYWIYTRKAIQLESKERREDGRPLCVTFRVGILEWSALDTDCACQGCVATRTGA